MRHPAVYLIGAGPGDPGLITVHGLNHLRAADVVVYDHLVPRRLLRYARQGAELIDVGTASPQAMEQEAISYLLVEKARDGKLVARLVNFVAPLRDAGAPVTAAPDVPAAPKS